MISPTKTPSLDRQRKAVVKSIARLRDEVEDLVDSLDLLEARARNLGKPRFTLAEVKKKLALK